MADILEQLNKSYNPWHADDESSISQGEAEAWRLYVGVLFDGSRERTHN